MWLIDPNVGFSLAGQLMLIMWLLLVISLWVHRLHALVDGLGMFWLPILIGLWYLLLIMSNMPFEEGGYGSLVQVRALFADDELLLAGWLHFLVFDFFVGTWVARQARGESVWRVLVAPCLVLCFLAGPVGLLAWLLLRSGSRMIRRPSVTTP